MSEDLFSRRSVRAYISYHGISRNDFLVARSKARVSPKDWNSMLSELDQRKLLPHVNETKATSRVRRRIVVEPAAVARPPKPTPPPLPAKSMEDVRVEIRRATEKLAKWRNAAVAFAKQHHADDRGRCATCKVPAPCPVGSHMLSLDRDLTERIALADSGASLDDTGRIRDRDPEWQIRLLYSARQSFMRLVVKATVDHMLPDAGRCTVCGTADPCNTKRALQRINQGIADWIENDCAPMSDGALNAKLGIEPDYPDFDDVTYPELG